MSSVSLPLYRICARLNFFVIPTPFNSIWLPSLLNRCAGNKIPLFLYSWCEMRRKTAPLMEQSVTSNWISFAFFRFVMTYAWLNSSSKLKLVFIGVIFSSYSNELGLFSPWWCKVFLSNLVMLSSALFRKRFSFKAIRFVNQNHKKFTSGDCKKFFNFSNSLIFLFVKKLGK